MNRDNGGNTIDLNLVGKCSLSLSDYRKEEIITLYNVCTVPWGVFSTVGDVQYRGGYDEYRGGIS